MLVKKFHKATFWNLIPLINRKLFIELEWYISWHPWICFSCVSLEFFLQQQMFMYTKRDKCWTVHINRTHAQFLPESNLHRTPVLSLNLRGSSPLPEPVISGTFRSEPKCDLWAQTGQAVQLVFLQQLRLNIWLSYANCCPNVQKRDQQPCTVVSLLQLHSVAHLLLTQLAFVYYFCLTLGNNKLGIKLSINKGNAM